MLTRNQNGAIRLDNQRVDMYQLACWLGTYNRVNSMRHCPGTLTEALVRQAVDEDYGIAAWTRTARLTEET